MTNRALAKGLALMPLLIVATAGVAVADWDQRSEVIRTVKDHFLAERFEEIDRLVAEYTEKDSRFRTGLHKHDYVFMATQSIRPRDRRDEAAWKSIEDKALRWIEARPTSAAAYIFYARLRHFHSWGVRGNGYKEDIDPARLAAFLEMATGARDFLDEHKEVASTDPLWYSSMLGILGSIPDQGARFTAVRDEGIERFPYSHEIYFRAAELYLPTYGGSNPAALERLAVRAVEKTRDREGESLYTRVYWTAIQLGYGPKLFEQTQVSWPRMKRGMDDILERYPDSYNVNHFALYACMAGDRAKTAELIARIEGPPLMRAWRKPEIFEACKAAGAEPDPT